MSRHRHVRNINIDDELDDDALSDGGEEDMTDEHHARLLYGLEHVREVLGDERISGLTDKEIKDTLWHYFFDEEKAIQWAIEEQQRRQRKGLNLSKDLPPVPQEDENGFSNIEYYHSEQNQREDSSLSVERPRGPLVFQHQQPGSLDTSDMEGPRAVRLSTITERTERTEITPRYATGHTLTPHAPRVPSSSFTASSYGEIIEQNRTSAMTQGTSDPNRIPVSPSLSALNELSTFEPPPSLADSEARSIRTATPRTASEAMPPSDDLPEIPDFNSKSAGEPPSLTSPAKKSKLSLLASSRLTSTRSESSRSSGVALKGSVKTFPTLRPSAESAAPASRIIPSRSSSSQSSSHLPDANEEYYHPPSSSMSSHVRRAIQTAMNRAREDQAAQPTTTIHTPTALPPATPQQPSAKVNVPTLSEHQLQLEDSVTLSSQASTTKPTQPYQEVDTFRPQSKLALLAQKKALQTNQVKVPKPVTEYLTPVGNGPTVTTAITTSYQNLYTLTDPLRSRVIPAQHVVPLGMTPPVESKPSKLANKIKKAHQRQSPTTDPGHELITSLIPPMFDPGASAQIRASPSAFASLLVDDPLISAEDEIGSRPKEQKQKSQSDPLQPTRSSRGHRHKARKSGQKQHPVPNFSPPMGFKFDAPSPDDIVTNARQGTSLASPSNKPSPSATRKAMSSK